MCDVSTDHDYDSPNKVHYYVSYTMKATLVLPIAGIPIGTTLDFGDINEIIHGTV